MDLVTEPAVCDANQNINQDQTQFKLQAIWSICFIKHLVSSHSNLQPNWCSLFLDTNKYIDIVFNQQCGVEYSLTWNRRKCTNICLRLVIAWLFYFKRVFFRFSDGNIAKPLFKYQISNFKLYTTSLPLSVSMND